VADSSTSSRTSGSDSSPAIDAGPAWPSPRSRIDRAAEDAALACAARGKPDEALKILMVAYGVPLTAFALRILRDRELVKDVRQQVFLEAFQGFDRFQRRSSLWSWLCGIAYHRCIDELRRIRKTGAVDDLDVLDEVIASSDTPMDAERVARYQALEYCLQTLAAAMRSQVLMRYFLGLSYAEIAEAIGIPHGTVQVRISRVLPRLRRCLYGEGVVR
jgi:RNA polymerase sigma-70 factor, ECF subfamily